MSAPQLRQYVKQNVDAQVTLGLPPLLVSRSLVILSATPPLRRQTDNLMENFAGSLE